MSRLLPAALAAALLLPATASARDYADTARNVVPSGQWGEAPVPAGADSQAKLYDSLTPRFDQVTAADLNTSFKSEGFGVGPDGPAKRERVPRRGVKIVRDRYDVPHITGRKRDDVTWAMGWVLQEDRGLLLAQGRYPARLAAVDAPNIKAFGLVTGLKSVTPSKQINRIIRRNGLRALRTAGPDGKRLLHDIDVFIDGINARMHADRSTAERFTRVDLFAVNALVGQIFGEGGGKEGLRGQFYGALRARLGNSAAKTLFDDLSEHNDADTPTTMTRTTPYERIPKTPRGNAILDAGSLHKTLTAGASAASKGTPNWASNFLIVGSKRSTTGHPLFVGGPQIGYFYPGLTLEADVRWPGHQARGVYSPANPGTILIGRGEDFAWSLTSAGSDLIDEYAEILCGGSSTRYRYRGKCRRMGTVNAGSVKGEGSIRYRTTVHGPVTGYATAGGRRVAIARKRASFGRDVLWQLPFRDATIGRITGTRSFVKAFARSPFTFNVGYADDRDIAMFSAGQLPRRDPRVDPRLPTLGTGGYEWRGILPSRKLPQQVNPSGGALLNWNNKPAPGFGAADDNWSYGSLHRVSLLRNQIARHATHDLASVTSAMNAAATQDLRSTALTPTLSTLLHGGPAPSARAQRSLELLEAWRATGSSRLDRDGDGAMDAGGAPAIMDAFYPHLVDAVLGGALGPQLADLKSLEGANNGPGSGFTGGGINYVDKDLRQLLGTRFRHPFKTRFCGGGDVNACRTAVWNALDAAGQELESAQGSASPDAWKSDAAKERIAFAPGLLTTKIAYTNRPSGIQQVISFKGHRSRRR
ncbi:MAG: penicillin acylase family protein [Solirubrobacteraceae bacterium]